MIHADKSISEPEAGNQDNPLDLTSEADENGNENETTAFRISPRQNARHSVSVTPAVSKENSPDEIEQANKSSPVASPSDLKNKRNAEAFSAEKSRQHSLTSSARFELVRKQRRQAREKIHEACGKARKVKERARKDAAAAQACLVDDDDDGDALLGSPEPYVLVERSEAPDEFVDFTTSLQVAAKVSSKSGGVFQVWHRKIGAVGQEEAVADEELEGRGHGVDGTCCLRLRRCRRVMDTIDFRG